MLAATTWIGRRKKIIHTVWYKLCNDFKGFNLSFNGNLTTCNVKEKEKRINIKKAIHISWPNRDIAMTFPYLSPSYLSLIIFQPDFWWFQQLCAVSYSCEQMLPRSPYVLPFCLYCQPAYPSLMELLKSRYESNLGGPAFVRACFPIRWEHSDKNLSSACRSCRSLHNNIGCVAEKKNVARNECFGHEFLWVVVSLGKYMQSSAYYFNKTVFFEYILTALTEQQIIYKIYKHFINWSA